MKEKIFNNFSLKILSAICAIILWAVIVNIYDPTLGFTVSNVTVQMVNADALTDKDYTYEVVDGSKISVYISGPKSVVTAITASDIVATADLSKITTFADYVDIDVKVVKDGVTLTNVEVTPKTTAVKLNIENRETQSFNVEFETSGQVASGYEVINQAISPTSIKVTGPSSSISNISHVKATVNLNDAVYDIEDTADIVLYDAEGNVITDSKLELSRTEVDYTATVRPSKSVQVKYGLSGNVANGYSITGVEVNPETIKIAGTQETIDSINEIVIPADAINVEGITQDTTFHVLVSNYIPTNVTLVSDNYITIRVRVSNSSESAVSVNMSDVSLTNVGQGLNATLVTKDAVNVKIFGDSQIISSLSSSSLAPVADLSGYAAGDYNVTLKFTSPSGCTINGDYTVQVHIEEAQTTTEPSSTSNSNSSTSAGSTTSG